MFILSANALVDPIAQQEPLYNKNARLALIKTQSTLEASFCSLYRFIEVSTNQNKFDSQGQPL